MFRHVQTIHVALLLQAPTSLSSTEEKGLEQATIKPWEPPRLDERGGQKISADVPFRIHPKPLIVPSLCTGSNLQV